MVDEHQLSERRACSRVGLSRDSYRNPPQPDQLTRDLGERILDIAHVRRRFGYRRIHDLLRSEFPGVNQNMRIQGPAKKASISKDSLVTDLTIPTRWPGVNPSSFIICKIRFKVLSAIEK
jgi:hypothetical protein